MLKKKKFQSRVKKYYVLIDFAMLLLTLTNFESFTVFKSPGSWLCTFVGHCGTVEIFQATMPARSRDCSDCFVVNFFQANLSIPS